jgi:hypothetical protein
VFCFIEPESAKLNEDIELAKTGLVSWAADFNLCNNQALGHT